MPEPLRWLLSNPIVLLIVVGWIASGIGGAVQRAARRAEAERRKGAPDPSAAGAQKPLGRRGANPEDIAREIRRAMGLEPPVPRTPPPPPVVPAARTAASPPVRTAAARPSVPAPEGAPRPAAVRRLSQSPETSPALPASRRVERIDEVGARWNEFDEESRRVARSYDDAPRRAVVDYDLAPPRRSLSEEMKARTATSPEVGGLSRRDAHLGDRISGRHLDLHVRSGAAPGESRAGRPSGRALFDSSNPMAAIIAMEVLGPPIALRDRQLSHEV